MADQVRRAQARRRRERVVAAEPPPVDVGDRDDTLTVLFLCAHPALSPASAIALTLRAVGGLSTGEIARGFALSSPHMGLVRRRGKLTPTR